MNKMIESKYQDLTVTFTEEGWFNATEVAKRFGKEPYEWLRLPETERYIAALSRRSDPGKSRFTLTRKGNSTKFKQGTWFHPRLGIRFAQWLDVDFAVWCDEQIEGIISGKHPHYDWKRLRSEAASSFKVMTAILQLTREESGKTTAGHHYSNEARLINWALTGEFKAVDREALCAEDLDLLGRLESFNSVLIGHGIAYDERKERLKLFVDAGSALKLSTRSMIQPIPQGVIHERL